MSDRSLDQATVSDARRCRAFYAAIFFYELACDDRARAYRRFASLDVCLAEKVDGRLVPQPVRLREAGALRRKVYTFNSSAFKAGRFKSREVFDELKIPRLAFHFG